MAFCNSDQDMIFRILVIRLMTLSFDVAFFVFILLSILTIYLGFCFMILLESVGGNVPLYDCSNHNY